MRSRLCCLLALPLVITWTPTISASGIPHRIAFVSGDPVPSASPTKFFQFFSTPSINNGGDLAFWATASNPPFGSADVGIYRESEGSLVTIALQGAQVPGLDEGVIFQTIQGVLFNDEGETAFSAIISGPGIDSSNDTSLWIDSGGNKLLVAREGETAPGTTNNKVFVGQAGNLVFSNSGAAVFRSDVTPSGFWQHVGLWIYDQSGLQLIAQTGQQAPGLPAGTEFGDFFFNGNLLSLNASGHFAFSARTNGPIGGPRNGIWTNRSGSFDLLIKEGDIVPGTTRTFESFGSMSINALGDVAFHANTGLCCSSPDSIFSEGGGSLHLVAKSGDQVPGAEDGVIFGPLIGSLISDSGDTMFTGTIGGANPLHRGLWLEKGGALKTLAIGGQQAAGTPPGTTYTTSGQVFYGYVMNSVGQVAFSAGLAGAGVGDFEKGVWATDLEGNLRLIVRDGQAIDVNNDPLIEDFRTVLQIGALPVGSGSDGARSNFNSAGELALAILFSDGSQGLVVFDTQAPLSQLPGDFDADGDVDGKDFLAWQRGQSPSPLSAGDLADWQGNYGAGPLSAATAVPEPSCLMLVFGLVLLRRKRK